MPLTGPEYERYTRTAPTLNCETDGRWIASDESGYDGEDLLADGRYMMVAGVAVDDAEAELILRDLRKATNIQPTARELKFKHFQRGDRLERMSRLWRPGGALYGRCSVFVIDKRYAIMSKTIDLLAEEEAYRRGIDLYANGRARKLARALACDGRRALKDDRFERLEQAFVAFARRKDPGDRQAVIQTFYSEVEAAWAVSTLSPRHLNSSARRAYTPRSSTGAQGHRGTERAPSGTPRHRRRNPGEGVGRTTGPGQHHGRRAPRADGHPNRQDRGRPAYRSRSYSLLAAPSRTHPAHGPRQLP
ncbi:MULTISPECIES: hypothetical protein [unclassified Streptomyces]|uniref:hypothetical protein n=1 Tax=unclassified Streptomyces TaxID=2593676 RepID=UPI00131D7918|nr:MULTISPECIES: hypothetical protein [unclassified Streptomyces]